MSVGQQITWSTTNEKGSPVSSESLKGSKYILCFFPKALTPGCTQQMCSLSADLDKLGEEGYQVFGISADEASRQIEFQQKHNLTIPLLCDTNHSVSKEFGVYGEKKAFGRVTVGITRTTFIVDENNVITQVVNKINTKDHANQLLLAINPEKYAVEEKQELAAEEMNLSGRPRRQASLKPALIDSITEDDDDDDEEEEEEEEADVSDAEDASDAEDDGLKRRGSKKVTPAPSKRKSKKGDDEEDDDLSKKKRGRPSKTSLDAEEDAADQAEVQLTPVVEAPAVVDTMNDDVAAVPVVAVAEPVVPVTAPAPVVAEPVIQESAPVVAEPVVIEHAQQVEEGFVNVDDAQTVPADHTVVDAPAPVVQEEQPQQFNADDVVHVDAPVVGQQ